FTCVAGHADCDLVPSTGCEVDTGTDAKNCGGCGVACAAPNAVTGCVKGACVVTGCAAGYADCDGKYDNGCEVNSDTDPANCGKCAATCGGAHGQVRCVMGACTLTGCAPTFADCDN